MSDPWSSVMPGGVSFSRQDDDTEEEAWDYTPDAEEVDETQAHEGDTPVEGEGDLPVEVDPNEGAPVEDASVEGEVSTDVDATVQPDAGTSSGVMAEWDEAPSLPTAPVGVLPVTRPRPVVRVLPKAPPGLTGEGVLPSYPPTTVPDPTDGEGEVVPAPEVASEVVSEVPADTGEGESTRGGLHRVPSAPRGPRPAWMTNPVFADPTDEDDTEGDDTEVDEAEGEVVPEVPEVPVPAVVALPVRPVTPVTPATSPVVPVDLPVVALPVSGGDPSEEEPEEGDADEGDWADDGGTTMFIGAQREEDTLPDTDDDGNEGVEQDEVGEVGVPEGYTVDQTTGELIPIVVPAQSVPSVSLPTVVPVTPAAQVVPEVVPDVPSIPSVPVVALGRTTGGKKPVLDVGADWSADDLLNPDSDEAVAEKRENKKAAAKKKNKDYSIALTDRDMAMLQFLARYRFATYPQLARYFETTPVALRQRMPRLAKENIVVRKTIGKSQHGVWLPTDTGVKVSGLDLPTPTLSWATAAHTLGLVDVGVMYELEGETVVTEREVRAADTRDRPSARMMSAMKYAGVDPDEPIEDGSLRMYVVNLGGGDSHYGHIPDMVLVRPPAADGSPASVAIELELVHKPATQWRKLLRAYLNAPHFGEVIYYTSQRKIAAGVAKAAQEVGAEHMVSVRRFQPSESSAIAQSSK